MEYTQFSQHLICRERNPETYKDIYKLLTKNTRELKLPKGEFVRRRIDRNAIEHAIQTHFSWTQLTQYYDYETMEQILHELGRDEAEQRTLLESFDKDALSFYWTNDNFYKAS